MPNIKALHIGDQIRILRVPEADLKEREKSECSQGDILPTATVIEKVIEQFNTVTIDHIDEYGNPWVSVDIEVDGEIEHHTLAIMDEGSWEFVERRTPSNKKSYEQDLKEKIDRITLEFEKEFQELADKSEWLYDQQEDLKKAYEELDKQTGLNALYEEFYHLKMAQKRRGYLRKLLWIFMLFSLIAGVTFLYQISVTYDSQNIVWQELRVSLKNDLGKNPSISEVRTLIEERYVDTSKGLSADVSIQNDIFLIKVPLSQDLKEADLLDSRGALKATYDIFEK